MSPLAEAIIDLSDAAIFPALSTGDHEQGAILNVSLQIPQKVGMTSRGEIEPGSGSAVGPGCFETGRFEIGMKHPPPRQR
jgi:hypothetical protein